MNGTRNHLGKTMLCSGQHAVWAFSGSSGQGRPESGEFDPGQHLTVDDVKVVSESHISNGGRDSHQTVAN